MVQVRKLNEPRELDKLSTLMGSAEVEADGLEQRVAYGSAPHVESQAEADMKFGSTEVTTELPLIDEKFLARLDDWLGPVEHYKITVAIAEQNIADSEFPEDLRERLIEALAGWRAVEAEHAEIFRTLAVLVPSDRIYEYF